MRKDKTYELRIEEDDELSGIDSISLVSEPAIEINWVAFNKVKPQEFHIPDGEDDKYIQKLLATAQDEQELFNEGWVVHSIELLDDKEGFVSTNPNGPSIEDEEEYNVRYKYILNPRITGQGAIIPTTRDFCKTLINKNFVWRVEDMDNTQNDFGQSAMVWRGGFNCRHVWSRIKYKKDATITNKASVNKGKVEVGGFPNDLIPDTRVLGLSEPNTVTNKTLGNPSPSTVRNLGLSKQKFEEGCPTSTQDVATNLKNRQNAIDTANYGPLNPNEPNEDYWKAKAKMFGGDVESAKKARCGNCAFFVQTQKMLNCISEGINDENEWDTIKAGDLGYCEAFDFKCAAGRTCDAWVVGGPITDEDMGYDVGTITGYVDEGIRKKKKKKQENFETYNDYPDAAVNAAKRALKWADENGWGSCGTPVGKQRANQLANRENISEETISRMASFARHRQNKDVPYSEGCGGLMWDAWGGTAGIEWAQNKLEEINKTNMSKQNFQTDDEKRTVVGPAMVPNLKIYRQKKNGDPYYVTFKADTIKMIMEKYMRNKYIDNNDTEHNGKAASDVYVIESWIKEDNQDKSNKYGFEDLPIGTWFVSMKVRNDEVWKRIKNKELNGFSVSGYFEEIEQFYREQEFLRQVAKILKDL
jgi:hypothetical protein